MALTSQYTNCVRIFSHGVTAPSGSRTPRYRGFTITHTHTHTHTHTTRLDSSGRVIIPSKRPLLDDKQHSQEKYSRFEPAIPTSERPQAHGLDRAATGVDMHVLMYVNMNTLCVCMYKRMGASCMHVRVYVITYVFLDVKLPTNDRKETSESP